jgi:hypothetical protein
METLNNTAPQTDVIVIESPDNNTSLQLLSKREQELIALREEIKTLVIVDSDDKKGYNAVRDARLKAKKARTSVVNDAKKIREGANKFISTVIAEQNRLIEIIEPEECRLVKMEEAFEEEQERRRIEEERKEQKRIQDRVDALAKFNHGIDHYDAKVMPEEDFQALLGHAEAEFNKGQERIAKEKADAEAARIAEQERLRIERKKLELEQAELKRQQEVMEENQRAQEAALREERERNEKAAREERQRIADEKRKADLELAERSRILREEIDAKTKERAAELLKYGCTEWPFHTLGAASYQDYKMFLAGVKESFDRKQAEQLAEAERKAEEDRKRQEAIAPDKEKLFAFGWKIMGVITSEFPDPASLSPESNELLSSFIGQLKAACDEFGHKVNTL